MKNFTMLPNKILKLFMSQELTSSDKSVLAVIVRETLGYNRDSWQISKREFASKTGFSWRSINYSLEKLERMQYIALVNKGNSRLNFSEWKLNIEPMQPIAQDTPRPMQSTASTYAKARRGTVPVNTRLNTDDDINWILSNVKNASMKGELLYVGERRVYSPANYRKKIESSKPAPQKLIDGATFDYEAQIVKGKVS